MASYLSMRAKQALESAVAASAYGAADDVLNNDVAEAVAPQSWMVAGGAFGLGAVLEVLGSLTRMPALGEIGEGFYIPAVFQAARNGTHILRQKLAQKATATTSYVAPVVVADATPVTPTVAFAPGMDGGDLYGASI